jgi:hypothetical protein
MKSNFVDELRIFRESSDFPMKRTNNNSISRYVPGSFRVDHLVRSLILGSVSKYAISLEDEVKRLQQQVDA